MNRLKRVYDGATLSGIAKTMGISTNISARKFASGSTLLHGFHRREQLRKGLYLHTSNAVEYEDFVSRTVVPAGLSFIFFLCGSVEIDVGGKRFAVGKNGQVLATVINRTEAEPFCRRSHHNQNVRQVVVTIAPEWLESDENIGWHGLRHFDLFVRTHLAARSWVPNPDIIAILERLLRHDHDGWIEKLRLEALVLSLIAASIEHLNGEKHIISKGLRNKETILTDRFNEFIRENIMEKWTSEEMSRHIGTSVSVLKRLTRKQYNMSLFEYIRFQRLNYARELLLQDRVSIEEVASQVGYSSAANLTTAFKELFGEPPHSFRQKIWKTS